MIYNIAQKIYDYVVRDHLPKRLQIKNGVAVPHPHRLLDINYHYSDTDYEDVLLDQLRRVVTADDDVIIVGGGYGVSMVLAAEHSYPNGLITVIEASVEQVKYLQDLAGHYDIEDRVRIIHGAVGTPRNPYGELGDVKTVNFEEIPAGDVFILDCEGGELAAIENLDKLSKKPEHIVVETHGVFNSPPDKVKDYLQSQGYSARETGIENEAKGMIILTAARE